MDNFICKIASRLGVGPEAVRNIEIYFHLGFREYIKTLIEHDQEDVTIFYKKKI